MALRRSSSTTGSTPAARTAGDDLPRRSPRGSSVRGLSLVTTLTSARRATASPIGARLAASRSPPQPKTHQTRPAVDGANGVEHARERVGRVRVVDEHGHVVARAVAALEATRRARLARRARRPRARDRAPSACAMPSATSRFSRLCAPDEARREAHVAGRRAHDRPRARRVEADVAGRDLRVRRRGVRPRADAHERRLHPPDAGRRPNASSTFRTAAPGPSSVKRRALVVGVRLHRAVEVEVVLREVRERGDANVDAAHAAERERVRRDLHRDVRGAARAHLRHRARDVVGLGRRVLGVRATSRRSACPTVPSTPQTRAPSAPSIAARARCAVVVLPLVPVIPTTSRENDGCP